MNESSADADLLVVGAGPAGVAAAVMASSLRMRTTVIEAARVGAKVEAIGSLENVPGGWTTGQALAEALAADIARHQEAGRLELLSGRAVRVDGQTDRAEVTLEDGRVLTAGAVVVATGVTTLGAADVDWIEAPDDLWVPPLWRATAEDLEGRHVVVLGADRPLGTWLRAHPQTAVHLDVLYPAGDSYKTDEVTDDPRLRLDLVERVAVAPIPGGRFRVTAHHPQGGSHTFTTEAVLSNMGSKPAALAGLVTGPDGYCPPEQQHPRVLVAGDLKGARLQRIAVAVGDGSRASLLPYYEAQALSVS
ncbi:FAD-dependent oxidoreductase [Streptomyces ipomoeae]|uniref:FAD-dependent oxidoreductase n=1 Tax=Streptomyces ipomoeae TaxID=103232 RepID=UPI001146B1F2|nr:FAD-dependent oxidoreductase [Streptomyces ipomoeae]TQE33185.1 NAD(P)/FAD-dependent oxidoreductase [Streptomyces ipomoeae]